MSLSKVELEEESTRAVAVTIALCHFLTQKYTFMPVMTFAPLCQNYSVKSCTIRW